MPTSRLHQDVEPRHHALRVISVICDVAGACLLLVGGLILCYLLFVVLTGTPPAPPRDAGVLAPRTVTTGSLFTGLSRAVIGIWAAGLLYGGVQFLTLGALFRLAIQVEENTRRTAECLESLCSRLEPRTDNPGPLFVS